MQTTDPIPHLARHDEAWAAVGAAVQATGSPWVALGPGTTLVQADALATLAALPAAVLTAVVTDPPYGAREFDDDQQAKLNELRTKFGAMFAELAKQRDAILTDEQKTARGEAEKKIREQSGWIFIALCRRKPTSTIIIL